MITDVFGYLSHRDTEIFCFFFLLSGVRLGYGE
jgi:hypothetical protein